MNEYLLPLAVVSAFFAWRLAHGIRLRRVIPRLLTAGATVIDVRTPGEFAGGHAHGSINVPLGDLAGAEIPADRGRWIIVCCASGTRSGIAKGILRRRGFANVINGGTWLNIARSRND